MYCHCETKEKINETKQKLTQKDILAGQTGCHWNNKEMMTEKDRTTMLKACRKKKKKVGCQIRTSRQLMNDLGCPKRQRSAIMQHLEEKRNDRTRLSDYIIMDTEKFAAALHCITEALQKFVDLLQALDVSRKVDAVVKEGHSLQWHGLKQKRLEVRDQACLLAKSISVRVEESKFAIKSATEIDHFIDIMSAVNVDQIEKKLAALIGEGNALLQEYQSILGQKDVWDNHATCAAGLLNGGAALASILAAMLAPLLPTAVFSSGADMAYLRHKAKELKELQQQLSCLVMNQHLQSTSSYSGPLLNAQRLGGKMNVLLGNHLDSVDRACTRVLRNIYSLV